MKAGKTAYFGILLAIALLGGLLLTLCVVCLYLLAIKSGLVAGGGETIRKIADALLDQGGKLGGALKFLGVEPGSLKQLMLLVFGIGVVLTATKAWQAEWPNRVFAWMFSGFDTDAFSPVPAAHAFDPFRGIAGGAEAGLPWSPPREGERMEIWRGLLNLARTGMSSDRAWRWFYRPAVPFSYAVVLGSAGLGKSRTAMEFARHLAAGGQVAAHASGDRRRATLGQWFRLRVLGQPPREGDLWDAGWISPERFDDGAVATPVANSDASWLARKRLPGSGIDTIRVWRPRYPTVLVLDDPRAGDLRRVIEILDEAAKGYRHAVRLVVVSQFPADALEIGRDAKSAIWLITIKSPVVPPLVWSRDSTFDATDIRVTRGGLHTLGRDKEVKQFLRATEGIPLIAEAGFEALRRGAPLADISVTKILQERAGRIAAMMREAGLSFRQHLVIALATLVGGLSRDDLDDAPGTLTIEPEQLRQIFPDEAMSANRIPPIRPRLIGIAFVAATLNDEENYTDKDAAWVIQTAWLVAPLTMLSAIPMLRRGGGRLVKLLAEAPDASAIGLAPLVLTIAFVKFAIAVPRNQWGENSAHSARDLEAACRVLIDRLSILDVIELAVRIGSIVEGIMNDKNIVLLEQECGRIVSHIFSAGIDAGSVDQTQKNDILESYDSLLNQLQSRSAALLGLSSFDLVDRMATWREDIAETMTDPLASAVLWRKAAYSAIAHPALCEKFADRVIELTEPHRGMLAFEGERAFACRFAAYANIGTAVICERYAAEVDSCAAYFDKDLKLEYHRAQAWRYAADSRTADADRCRLYATIVDEIAVPFSANRGFQKERAIAWFHAAYANIASPGTCELCAQTVDRISEPFAADRDFQRARAIAWRHAVYSRIAEPRACESNARRVDQIVEPFAGDRDLELQRARAWRMVSYACIADAVACVFYARMVDEIAAPFSSDREFVLQRAIAWRHAASARISDPVTCKTFAEAIDRIAGGFADDAEFGGERAIAWRVAAESWKDDQEEARFCAQKVEEIARALPNTATITRELQLTRQIVSRATS